MPPPPPLASIPLLRVKMLPPSPGLAILRRARLMDRLREGVENLQRRATVVVAGAGYGKTTLVADFLRTSGVESVWYSIDRSDRDPIIFFRYIIDGIREHSEEFGRLAEAVLSDLPSLTEGVERFVDVLINDANEALSARMILVLDDFHHLDGSEVILRAVRRLVAYLPDSLHIILVSRTVPDIGTAHLKSKGSLNVIDREDLLFSEEETNSLLTKVLGFRMDRAAVRALQERTQGWVTALHLLRQDAVGLVEASGRPSAEVFARTEAEIFEYFSEGVLAGESVEMQRFLRRSSLLAILEPEICARVLDDMSVRGLLESLLRRNLFTVPLAGRTDDYIYHPLFREFLARKLTQVEGETAARDLHRRYARCFEERGEIASALPHYIQGGDPEAIDSLLAREGPRLLEHGMLETVRMACASLQELGSVQPRTELIQGEIARIEGDYNAAAGFFHRGLASVSLRPQERAEGLQGLAYVELKLGQLPPAVAHANEALRLAGERDLLLRAKILNIVSIAEYRSGRYDSAMEGWRSALDLARRGGDTALVRKVAHNLGLPYGMWGDYDKALDCFRILLNPGEDGEQVLDPDSATASLNVARIEILRGEYREAAGHLDDALEITRKYRLRALQGDVLEAQGILLRETGDLSRAREKYFGARQISTELGLDDLAGGLDEEEALLLLASGSTAEALRLAEEMTRSRAAAPPERLAPALLVAGKARLASGDGAGAREALNKARDLYQGLAFRLLEAEAGLLLAQALLLSGDQSGAIGPAREALDLAERFGYVHMVRRLAASSDELRRLLGSQGETAAGLVGAEAGPDGPRWAGGSPSARRAAVGGALGGYDLTVSMLGPVEVYRDELRQIPASAWTLKRALKILCYLAASRDHRATKDRIIDTFWNDARPSMIQKNFHPTISYLRKALNFSHAVNKNFILFEKGAYLLNPAYRYRLDTNLFEAAVAAARRKARARDAAGALASYGEAIALYRGEFLEEDYDEWVEAPRTHYAALLAGALEEAGSLCVSAGKLEEGLSCFERLSRMDPLSEDWSCRVMEMLGAMGNRAGVEREFGRLVKELTRELDLEPLPETRQVYERALAGDAPVGGRAGGSIRGRPSRPSGG